MTTDPASEPHVAAMVNLLTANLPHLVGVEIGVAPARKPPYVVLYPYPGTVHAARLCYDQGDIHVRVLAHIVGEGPEQCMWTMDQCTNVLAGAILSVPGRAVQPVTQTLGPQPMTRDQTLQPPVFLTVAEYAIRSQRGSTSGY